LTSDDPDAANSLTFSVVASPGGNNNSLFEIHDSTLSIIQVTDFETRDNYSTSRDFGKSKKEV